MAAEAKVQQELRLLEEAGCLDLVRPGAAADACPVRKAASSVAAAVMACSPPRHVTGLKKVSPLGKGKARPFGGRARGRGEVRIPRLLRQAPITHLELVSPASSPEGLLLDYEDDDSQWQDLEEEVQEGESEDGSWGGLWG
ncbi:hypothetical protein NDU88_006864 [Pleurodeles waltl]|uniref:Uncharacterized protein n=1 Tax=Pleurodeles waltl TaxID=8319 RepID=A0AAV7PMA9_PLEWA|nr:hypothetical protein NDU88_006864 [Pleurodeles waltl]